MKISSSRSKWDDEKKAKAEPEGRGHKFVQDIYRKTTGRNPTKLATDLLEGKTPTRC